MLQSLLVENYALIDRLEINFKHGLSIVTGETGAGKSILLGAMGMLIGQRADVSILKDKESSCIVEGMFVVTNHDLEPLFEANDIDFSNVSTIRRVVNPNGKSRAFINDVPVTLSVLKDFGERLIDIHSQHQNLLLQNAAFQLKVVDSLADSKKYLEPYRTVFFSLKKTEQRLQELEEQARLSKNDLEYYSFLFKELEEAKLNPDEQQELEAEQQQLTHAEEIKQVFAKASLILSNDDVCATSLLREVKDLLEKMGGMFDKAEALADRLQSSLIEVRDIANEVESVAESTEVNSERLQEVNDRLDLIYTLQKKHKVNSVEELLTVHEQLSQKIGFVDNIDEQLVLLRKEVEQLRAEAEKLATQISKARKQVFPAVEQHVSNLLSDLGMPSAKFVVECNEFPALTATGKDEISFLFSANKGVAPLDIAKVASGGEISRLMLSLKSLIAWTGNLPTIIFDEIDTGVSGEVAAKMGAIIAELGKSIQVINITHLPQIASKGQSHFLVYKEDIPAGVATRIKLLSEIERITQIAKMLSGQTLTDAAIKNAKELLKG
ncbi:MAG: DNA repair protein RecN [Prevotellaceae bacterium]|jgi:DNA repair protein RecN (Recombination protein N)|nr:DNA repair protein RecN [Prevotellaceae bacterium]